MTTSLQPFASARQIRHDAPVLGSRPLRDGVELAHCAVFGDDVWPLTPAVLRVDAHKLSLHFATVPLRFRGATKELCYALLIGDLPAGEVLVGVVTVRKLFSAFVKFLTWAEPRRTRLAELSSSDLSDFHAHLLAARHSVAWVQHHWRACRLFWIYREKLTADGLSLDPDELPCWAAWSRTNRQTRPGENLTTRLPEEVLGPLLGWALRFVDDFATDILTARDEYLRLRFTRTPAGSSARARFAALLQEYRRDRLPLPVARPVHVLKAARGGRAPNVHFLAREIGLNRIKVDAPSWSALLDEAVADVGLSDDSYLRTPMGGLLDGQPWLSAIPYFDVPELERHLHTACWIVVAYLSGMRDSEVKHLRRGCLSTLRDPTGRPYRRRVHSLAFKGEADPAGVPATWIVGAPVERAIAVLERLQPPTTEYLFASNPTSHLQRRNLFAAAASLQPGQLMAAGPVEVPQRLPIPSGRTNRRLHTFIAWVNSYCAHTQRADRIPQNGNGEVSTRQFRRTLAWFIARRPGGAIAGAIQYRHQHIQMFEGYAGTSTSGFRDEVEAEQALARGQFLAATALDLDQDAHNGRLTGPAAREAEQRLAEFGRHACFDGQVITDERRLQRILTRHDPHVYPGTFVTCIYNADRALCRVRDDTEMTAAQPVLSDCQPLACRNVALTEANRSAITTHLDQLDATLASPTLPPYQQHRLQQRRDELAAFLARRTEPDTRS